MAKPLWWVTMHPVPNGVGGLVLKPLPLAPSVLRQGASCSPDDSSLLIAHA